MPYIVKKTLDAIIETNNNYVVCVKKNRHKLYTMMEENIRNHGSTNNSFTKTELNRGRLENRILECFKVSQEIKAKYPHSKTVILVNRERICNNKLSQEKVYYLSNQSLSSEEFYKGIRGHWSIENKLHYVKDVVMNEDKANLKNKLIASIFSILRSFVITIAKFFLYSVTSFQRTYAHDMQLIKLL